MAFDPGQDKQQAVLIAREDFIKRFRENLEGKGKTGKK